MAANSKATTTAASATAVVFKIKCGNLTGTLYTERFGPAGKSACIKLTSENSKKKLTASENNSMSSEWLSPIEFEKLAGKGAQHNWKRTVRSVTHDNKTMYYLLEQGILKQCEEKHCDCSPCSLLNMKKGIEIVTQKICVGSCLSGTYYHMITSAIEIILGTIVPLVLVIGKSQQNIV